MKINFNKSLFKDKYICMVQNVFENAIINLNLPEELEVNVALVNKSTIKQLNRDFRQNDSVTDVLSFPIIANGEILTDFNKENYPQDVNPENGNLMLGDIYICFQQVKEQAKEYRHSLEREFSYLALHGLLHLLGYDHMDEKSKSVMRATEEKIIQVKE